ncbi:MAG TPA: hypothetical protein VFA23_03125 [Dongiaceae bacterium]|nr:hypothetical protein [Dongiaceae bacterium]
MALFQCFFFSDGRIGYWENIERDTEASLRSKLLNMLCDGEWEAAEAWRDDRLVCRALRLANGSCSVGFSPDAIEEASTSLH